MDVSTKTISADALAAGTITLIPNNQLPKASLVIGDIVLNEETLSAMLTQKPVNCVNCGAVLINGKCSYCGAEY